MSSVRLRLLELRQELLREDREKQFYDDYERRFVPKAISLRHDLINRVPFPARTGDDAGRKGRTFLDIYGIADDLDALANLLGKDKCSATLRATRIPK